MRHIIPAIIALIALGRFASAVQAEQTPRIVIAAFMEQESVTEVEIKIMTEAYKRLGMIMEIKYFPGERALQSANSGLVDGDIGRKADIQKTYPNLISIPVAINRVEFVVFTKVKNFQVKGWESLLPYKVGHVRGIKAIELNLLPGTQAGQGRTINHVMRELDAGIRDVVVDVRESGLAAIQTMRLHTVKVLEPPLLTINLFHCLNTKNKHLVAPLTTVLQQMEKEGTIRDIQRQTIHAAGQ